MTFWQSGTDPILLNDNTVLKFINFYSVLRMIPNHTTYNMY